MHLDEPDLDDLELRESLDRAFGGWPVRRPIEERLTAGRRALRRRRVASGAASFVGVLAVCGAGWAVLPGPGADAGSTWAASGGRAGGEAESAAAEVRLEDLITYDRRARLTVLPGAVVEHRVDGIVDRPGVRSTAAVVTYEGETFWAAAAALAGDEWGTAAGASWSSDAPADRDSTFEDWVAEQVEVNGLAIRCVVGGDSHDEQADLTIWPESSDTTCVDLRMGVPAYGQDSGER